MPAQLIAELFAYFTYRRVTLCLNNQILDQQAEIRTDAWSHDQTNPNISSKWSAMQTGK